MATAALHEPAASPAVSSLETKPHHERQKHAWLYDPRRLFAMARAGIACKFVTPPIPCLFSGHSCKHKEAGCTLRIPHLWLTPQLLPPVFSGAVRPWLGGTLLPYLSIAGVALRLSGCRAICQPCQTTCTWRPLPESL